MPIFDARLIANNFSLDREGFALVRHPNQVKDFYSDEEIRAVYYPAVEAFLRATLKADRVFIFDHTVRRRVEGCWSCGSYGSYNCPLSKYLLMEEMSVDRT